MRYSPECLHEAIRALLESYELSAEHAAYVADTLVETSLCGVDTHGVRLLPTYVRELEGGRSNPRPRFRCSNDRSATAVFFADDALGVVAANAAMRDAIERAKVHGIAALAVRDSNHFGAAGYYARLAAKQDQIGLVFSNSDALVSPANGSAALNGSNPLAMAASGIGDDGFFLDMATSQVSYSRVMEGRSHGAESRDPHASTRAPLTPLGGYKGQGLGTMVQILCALLGEMPFDTDLSHLYVQPYDTPRKIAHFILAIDVSRFVDPTAFRARMSQLLNAFRRSPADEEVPVMVPGDPEALARTERCREGIPLGDAEEACLSPFLSALAATS